MVESECPLLHVTPLHTEQQDIDFEEYVVVETRALDFLDDVFLELLILKNKWSNTLLTKKHPEDIESKEIILPAVCNLSNKEAWREIQGF